MYSSMCERCGQYESSHQKSCRFHLLDLKPVEDEVAAPPPLARLRPQEVLYTDDLWPITVLEVPESLRRRLESGSYVWIPVVRQISNVQFLKPPTPEDLVPPTSVRLWVEQFLRKGRKHFFLFTEDDENALLLRAAFLSGQRHAVDTVRAKEFAQGFLLGLQTVS